MLPLQELAALSGIAAALAAGVVSPGPSFVMVARTAVCASRREGIAAALGMAAGGVVFAVAALLGLHALLLAVPSLYLGLKLIGGLYLSYLGYRMWKSASQPLAVSHLGEAQATRPTRALALGFATQISNPKTAVIYASVFAAFLPGTPSLAFNITLVSLVFLIEIGWYSLVALALASRRPRAAYLRCKSRLDRLAGGVMIALGLRLVWSAHR